MAKGSKLLSRYLRDHGISKRELARRANMNPGYLCSLANGERTAGRSAGLKLDTATGGEVPYSSWES